MKQKPLVFIESPYQGDLQKHQWYLKMCILDSIKRGENPYASHGFFTQFLNDNNEKERELGLDLGNQWRHKCAYNVFYLDLGMSGGMLLGLRYCIIHNLIIVERKIL